MASCSEIPQGADRQASSRLALAADLPASTAAAFQSVDAARIQLIRDDDEEPAVDRRVAVEPSEGSAELSVQVSVRDDQETFQLILRLFAGEDLLFRAAESVTLEPGGTNRAEVQLEPVVDRIALNPDTSLVFRALGQTIQVDAMPLFATGESISNLAVSWRSLAPEVLQANDDGRLVSLAEGEARAVASVQGVEATIDVLIAPVVESVNVEPESATVSPGSTVQFSATPLGPNGNALSDRPATWESSNTGVATVDETGLATGVEPGTATIRARIEGVTGTASLQVDTEQVVIDFEDQEPGTYGTSLTISGVTFRSGASGIAVVSGDQAAYRSSRAMCSFVEVTCNGDLTVEFEGGATDVTFLAFADDSAGTAGTVDVFEDGQQIGTRDIQGDGDLATTTLVDLSEFGTITRLEVRPSDPAGLEYDDFTFTSSAAVGAAGEVRAVPAADPGPEPAGAARGEGRRGGR